MVGNAVSGHFNISDDHLLWSSVKIHVIFWHSGFNFQGLISKTSPVCSDEGFVCFVSPASFGRFDASTSGTKASWFSLSALFHAFLSSWQETDQNFTDFAQMQRRWPIFQLRLQTRTKKDNCWGLSMTVHVIIAVIAPMVFIDLRKLQRADNSLNCTGRGIVWEKLIFSCRYFGYFLGFCGFSDKMWLEKAETIRKDLDKMNSKRPPGPFQLAHLWN